MSFRHRRIMHDYYMPMSLGTFDMGRRELTEQDKAVGLETLTAVKTLARKVEIQPEPKSTNVALLKELGFEKIHSKTAEFATMRTKENMAILAGYTKIAWAEYEAADTALQQRTNYTLHLQMESVATYDGIPPVAVLGEMHKAVKAGVFDKFSIISVGKQVPDPILVGQINGTKDMFFIAEWGDDISLQELVG